jgi:hypothetical protein
MLSNYSLEIIPEALSPSEPTDTPLPQKRKLNVDFSLPDSDLQSSLTSVE